MFALSHQPEIHFFPSIDINLIEMAAVFLHIGFGKGYGKYIELSVYLIHVYGRVDREPLANNAEIFEFACRKLVTDHMSARVLVHSRVPIVGEVGCKIEPPFELNYRRVDFSLRWRFCQVFSAYLSHVLRKH